MSTLMRANREWSSRPADERFVNLYDMLDHFRTMAQNSREVAVSSRVLQAIPSADHKGIEITGPNGHGYAPTHWAFGQLATIAEAPAGYLRSLPAELACDNINWGLHKQDPRDLGVLLHKSDSGPMLRAATSVKYGRIWNRDIVESLVNRFGDGISGDFRVPGEFGRAVTVTKDNTTLFAGDRDLFVFLADEKNRVEIPNRRNGEPGQMARGLFIWNSEVGAKTFGLGTFLFDYVCKNRIVWGAKEYREVKIRHSITAPDRWIEQLAPAIEAMQAAPMWNIVENVKAAQAKRLDDDSVNDFLAKRFGKRMVETLKDRHMVEENRPIESLWDISTAVTAYARFVPHQDARVDLEREAGEIMALAA